MTEDSNRKRWDHDSATSVEIPTSISQARLRALGRAQWDHDAHTAEQPLDMPLPKEAYRDGEESLAPLELSPDRTKDSSGPRVIVQDTTQPDSPAPSNDIRHTADTMRGAPAAADLLVDDPEKTVVVPLLRRRKKKSNRLWVASVVTLCALVVGGLAAGRQLARLEAVQTFVRSLGLLD